MAESDTSDASCATSENSLYLDLQLHALTGVLTLLTTMLDSMNVSSYVQDFPFSQTPQIVWRYYLEYLWHYESSSWTISLISTFRIMAILPIAPLVLLAMLDIAAYVIARTLGIVEVAKASTNDSPILLREKPPPIIIEDTSQMADSGLSATDESLDTPPELARDHPTLDGLGELAKLDASLFSNEKLSGVGVFSPATSRPPSPSLSRRKLRTDSIGFGMGKLSDDEGLSIRKRPRRNTGAGISESSGGE